MYEFFQSLFQHLLNGIITIANWFGQIFQNLWNGLKQFFALLFEPLLLFFKGLWYLITKVFDIVVLSVQVIFGLFKVVWAIVAGIFNTFASLMAFSGTTDYYYLPGAYQQGWDGVAGFFVRTGLNTIALVCCVFCWILTAYAVIKIAGGER